MVLIGIIALTYLGLWQIHRREWKLRLIEQVDQRINAAPIIAPGTTGQGLAIISPDDAYRHVTAHGVFLHEDETFVHASTTLGSGYWVITPLRTDNGIILLVNRGFVPAAQRDPHCRAAGQIPGEVSITGLMRLTEPKGDLLRVNDPAGNRWYSRDVAAIAAAHHLTNVAPYFIDADGTSNPGGLPVGGLTVITFPNNHLLYAFTWFVLALMLAVGAFMSMYEQYRLRREIQRLR